MLSSFKKSEERNKGDPSGNCQESWGDYCIVYPVFYFGFYSTAYQVAWQRMLGLFSGSDVRSVTVVVASYLLGLGLGNLIISKICDRLNNRQCVRAYGICNLGVAIFAVSSRFLFYDLL